MKKALLLILFLFFAPKLFAHEQSTTQSGNNNTANICQPNIKIVQKDCKKCTSCKKPKVVYKTKYVKSEPKVIVKKAELNKNRLRLLGGYGPDGVSAEQQGPHVVAYEEKGMVIGVGYDRLITDEVSVGGQILNNSTYMLSIGLDF